MHIPTHILSGWCLADTLDLAPRERLSAMVAASAADLDGLGLFVSVEFYAEYHHVLGHNLLAGMLLSAGLATLASKPHRMKMFCLSLVLFHLHLVLDYYGSGPGWGFEYLWPFADLHVECEHAWELASWENFLAFGILLAWTGIIFVRRRRTPLEVICPSLEARAVRHLPK
ncbi:MAG TPA: metal-dependent hydrolase [Prosthecobacter sp.]